MTNKIAELKKEIKDVQNKINNFELDPDNFIDSYDEMLDEVEGDFMGYCASRVLKELDPIAYRCGLLDYVGSFDIEDSEEYQDLLSQLEDLEFEFELEDELENTTTDQSYDELLGLCKEKGLPLVLACIATDELNLLNTENLGDEAYQEYKEQIKQSIIE